MREIDAEALADAIVRFVEVAPEGHLVHWECPVPAFGIAFRVTDERWDDDFTVRTIHAVEIV